MQSSRITLSIGCDVYEHLASLSGAEKDAKDVFKVLTDNQLGEYDPKLSVLLLSPTREEMIRVFGNRILNSKPIDTLTIFFAGHGCLSHGSYYLCTRDSDPSMLSTSAMGLPTLFEIINEIAPSQCNLIIDACQAGGVVADLGNLLKPELIGKAQSSGISIFATSASDEFAGDSQQGGVGTQQLIEYLEGKTVVQAQRPFLDLVEVGRAISERFLERAESQTPVVWGLNLFGQSRFSRNPYFSEGVGNTIVPFGSIAIDSDAGQIIRENAEKLWALYYSSSIELTPARISRVLTPILERIGNGTQIASFIQGMAFTISGRVVDSPNLFSRAEAIATFIAMLLPSCGRDGEAELAIDSLLNTLTEEVSNCFEVLAVALDGDDRNYFLAGPEDFYYLPLRILRILGWGGAIQKIASSSQHLAGKCYPRLEEILKKLIELFSSSLVAMSDEQTPYFVMFIAAFSDSAISSDAEVLTSALFNNFLQADGNVASPYLDEDRVLEFLELREKGDFGARYDMLGRPTEMLSALLLAAGKLGLSEVFDIELRHLDHVSLNIFIPDSLNTFCKERINEGRNHTFQIGLGVWCVQDLISQWNQSCLPQIEADPLAKSPQVLLAGVCASLVFPDRTPWFLFARDRL